MKGGESGMPEETIWERFFEPEKVLNILQLDKSIQDVAEFGCGYGTFTIPPAKMISGKIYALDIEPEMIEITQRKARENKLSNVETILRDFMADGSGLGDKSVDYIMLFNILHLEDPEKLLKEAHRILKYDGRIGIIHWNYDSSTPRGPSMKIRPKPEQCIEWATNVGFSGPKMYDLKPYHYGIVMEKTK